MKRRFLTLTAIVSLVLSVGALIMYFRSQTWADWAVLRYSGRVVMVETRYGSFYFRWFTEDSNRSGLQYERRYVPRQPGRIYREPAFRIQPVVHSKDGTVVGRDVQVPCLALMIAFGAPPLAWFSYSLARHLRSAGYRRQGRCPT